MNEDTPLLRNQPGSNSSSDPNPGTPFSRRPTRRNARLVAIPASPSDAAERDETWVKNQRAFLHHAVSEPNLKQRLAYECDTGRRGRLWEFFDAMLSVMFFFLYIWNTQYVLPDNSTIPFPHSLQTADFVLACLILIQFLPRVWLDKEPFQYCFSYFAILTWISVFPVMIAYIQTIYDSEMDSTYMGVEKYVFVYPLRFVRAHLSVQILFIPVKSSLFSITLITRKGLKIGTTILFTFLTVASWIHIMTVKQASTHINLSFYDAFWFTVVSSTNGMSTDLIPENDFTRIVILYIMVAGAIFIPTHLTELLTLIQQRSKYERSFKREKNHEHVLVAGNFDTRSIFEFLREFFCQDHGLATMNTYVVVLNPEEPSDEMALLLEDPAFVHRVQYVKGSPAFRRSLVKVRADAASAAFLLSPKFSKDNDTDDASQLMRALALKKYNHDLPLYVQVHLPENVSHFDFLAKDVICIDELTMGLMAQSLITPGFSSLIVLLTTSVTDRVAKELIQNVHDAKELDWAIEYISGVQQEIYAVDLAKFVGKSFLECSEIIYHELDSILFSIGIYRTKTNIHSESLAADSSFQIFLNPQDYVLEGNEIGFVISDNAEITAKVTKFDNHKTNKWFDPYDGMNFIQSSAANLFNVNIKDSNPENVRKFNKDFESRGERKNYSSMSSSAPPPSFLNKKSSTTRRASSVIQVFPEDDSSNIPDGSEDMNILPGPSASDDTVRSEVLRMNIEKAKAYCDVPLDPNIANVENHVLICNCSSVFPVNLDIFVSVLREKNSTCHNMPVIILSICKPPDYEKNLLERFGNIYFVTGSPLRRKDLYRARVDHAKKCVVLCDDTLCDESRDIADAASLMAASNIESLSAKDCFVIIECMYRETFKMICESDSVKNKQEDYVQALMRPSFMGGSVFTATSLDTILCQCFYNRHIPLILKRLVFTHEADDENLSPRVDMRHGTDSASGHVFQVDVPPLYVGQRYGILYSHLVRCHKAVPLGLYRHTIHKACGQRYIYINPSKDCIVREDDRIYLISTKSPVFVDSDDIIEE